MVMLIMMLAKEVFAVVIAIGRSDHSVDVLSAGFAPRDEVSHTHWALMIKLNEQYCYALVLLKRLWTESERVP